MSRSARGDRLGVALVVTVLLLLALLVLAQGFLSFTRLELATAMADRRVLQARAAAETALREALTTPMPPDAQGVPLWGSARGPSDSLPGATFATRLDRLSREDWLAEGVGAARHGPGSVRIGAAIWVLDPVARVAAAGATLQVGAGAPLLVEGAIDGTRVTRVDPPLAPGACEPWTAALDSLFPLGWLPGIRTVTIADSAAARPSLGLLDGHALLARITRRISGAGTPAPTGIGGRCDTADPWNLGDPDRPGGLCDGYVPVEASEGSLTIRGGKGQGVLVVRDTLTLTDSARFYGVLLVGGLLRLGEGVRVTGLARAEGGAEMAPDARLDGSACWAALALNAGMDELGRPVLAGGPEWIGPF